MEKYLTAYEWNTFSGTEFFALSSYAVLQVGLATSPLPNQLSYSYSFSSYSGVIFIYLGLIWSCIFLENLGYTGI